MAPSTSPSTDAGDDVTAPATGTDPGSSSTPGEIDAPDGRDPDPGGGGQADVATVPGELLDLSNWKITLPVDDGAGGPLEIGEPELDSYAIDPYFDMDEAGDAVSFVANAGGATTSGSHYPRSELREMSGADKASWSMTSGVHTMTITEAITHTPDVKPHVVAGQIHDAADDVVMIRLEGTHLFVEGRGQPLGDLDPDYVLGTFFTVKIVATDGQISVYYEDMSTPAVVTPWTGDGCYFKAGVYTQSNPDHGEAPDAYGQVEIRALSVSHG